jgi:hypothetical protein
VQAQSQPEACKHSARWPGLFISLAPPTQYVVPSFAFLAKGGYRDRIHNGFRSPEGPPDNRTAGYGSLSHGKQGRN